MEDFKEGLSQEKIQNSLLFREENPQILAEQFGLPSYSTLTDFRVSKEIYQQIPYSFVKKNMIIPIKEEGDLILAAISDPLQLEAIEELRLMLNRKVKAVYSPKEIILEAIHDCYEKEQGVATELISKITKKSDFNLDDELEIYDLLDENQTQAPVIKLINLILTEAIQQGASDIHFEPFESSLRIRYRIDGVLHSRHSPASEFLMPLLTRIKVMAKMDIAEHRLPQDGRIKLKMGRREIDFRVSTVPVHGGERIVLRILDKGNVILGLEKMGMPQEIYQGLKKLIALPEGIILVTGPTGSGKTTTLYSSICDVYNEETNIMTIEDPVEYNLKGIAQIGVHHKIHLDFARGLRHILRQDPDIIMIGEIRDKETAEIAIQASLTGHLVLSTLHTNDAPSAITRLVDMGVEPYLLSSTIVGVLAQRLVRKICSECKVPHTPSDRELQSIGIDPKNLKEKTIYHGAGCKSCFGSGYKGRHGLYELMIVNNFIHKQIVKSADAIELRSLALKSGMHSLLEHGTALVLSGVTTASEVLRVTRGLEEA